MPRISKKKRREKKLRKIGFILTIISILSLSLFSYFIYKIDIIPHKYLMVGYIVAILIILLFMLTIFEKTKRGSIGFFVFLMSIGIVLINIANFYLGSTYSFLLGTQSKYDTLTYSVIVKKNSGFNKLDDLNNKTISYLDDMYKDQLKEKIKYVSYKEKLNSDFTIISKWLLNSQVDSIILEESYLNLAKEEINDFTNNIRVIDSFDIKVKSYKETDKIDITKDSFILYVSGIDQYGDVNSVRGRSDVNILVVVNPRTNHILLVNTPRDYYVQLHDTKGLKDKLTHAGIYGIDKSIKTLEDIYNININHYLRVNFNTLIKVVDVIGGIDIDSDKEFTSWTNGSVHINKGINHMDGKMALAYARERKAYTTGDNHRGENQQQVITAILNKISKSSTLLMKYNSIINSLDGSFQTDMNISFISSFVKYQLDRMPSWKIDSIAVTGFNSRNYTYSMGKNYYLYVMEPDYKSVNNAKNTINSVFNEKK